MRMSLAAASAAIVIALTCSAAGFASDATSGLRTVDLSSEISGHAGVTAFDLIRQVIPDLIKDADGGIAHRFILPRDIAGERSGGVMPGPVRIGVLRTLPFIAESKPRLAMLIGFGESADMGEQPALLAVFDIARRMPALSDVVNVGTDRFTSFAEPALVRIGKQDDAILTRSGHFNADETYDATALLFLRGGKLGLIDNFTAYGSRTCALTTSQSFAFNAAREARATPYYAITVTMRDRGEGAEAPCEDASAPLPYDRSASTIYRWDAGKAAFRPDSDAVRRLQQETAAQ